MFWGWAKLFSNTFFEADFFNSLFIAIEMKSEFCLHRVTQNNLISKKLNTRTELFSNGHLKEN